MLGSTWGRTLCQTSPQVVGRADAHPGAGDDNRGLVGMGVGQCSRVHEDTSYPDVISWPQTTGRPMSRYDLLALEWVNGIDLTVDGGLLAVRTAAANEGVGP